MTDRRRGVLWLTLAAVFVLVVSGVAFVAAGGQAGIARRTAAAGLWTVTPPPMATFGAARPVLDPDVTAGGGVSAQGITQALEPLLSAPGLGGSPGVSVVDIESGAALYTSRGVDLAAPASTTKIVTAAAVLTAVGPYHRFTTRVVAGATPGEVVLVGGGDPTLATGERGSYPGAARLDVLAAQVKAAGPVTKLTYDTSLFTGPETGPGWDSDTVSGSFSAPIAALTVDGGRVSPTPASPFVKTTRSAAPARFAALAFARLLGVSAGNVTAGTAPANAREVAKLDSPPVQHLVELMLQLSDNTLAEALLRQVAVARSQPASFEGGVAAAKAVLTELGIDTAGYGLVDGSGLSRENRLAPQLLTEVLKAAAGPDHPELRGVLTGLPVAAYSGTLALRFAADGAQPGAGEVRAKTGTLSGVSALSGVVMTDSGQQLAFAVLANGVPDKIPAERALDKVGAALAACGCK